MTYDELLAYLFADQPHPLAATMATWLASSRRFSAFVDAFRSKIRKKIRLIQDHDSALDLHLELETAYLLLQERTFELAYEPHDHGNARSPDFAVATPSTRYMVEVTRLRIAAVEPAEVAQPLSHERSLLVSDRLVDTIAGKLGQLVPQNSNVLIVSLAEPRFTPEDVRATMRLVQQRAERGDPDFMHRHAFRDRADFFKQYQRLSELLVRGPQLQPHTVLAWTNPQAKHPLPSKLRTALYRSHES